MPENDFLRRSLDAGLAFTQLTRERAEKLVKDLVQAGEVSREEAASRVEQMLERSRQNTDQVLAIVRKEIDDRLGQLNFVTRDDLAKLAARIVPGAKPVRKVAPAKAPAKTAPVKKAAVKKAAAKKAPVKKAPAKKAPAKKATPAS